jgi:zinc resistance-associated protein
MIPMRTTIYVALAVCVLAAPLPAYTQQSGSDTSGKRWHPTAAQAAALTEANLSALKAALNLTPEQAKNWPALEQAIRDVAKKRAERLNAWRESEQTPETHFDRVRQRAAALAKIAAGLTEYADAAAPLFASLDSSQKQLFIALTTKWVRP